MNTADHHGPEDLTEPGERAVVRAFEEARTPPTGVAWSTIADTAVRRGTRRRRVHRSATALGSLAAASVVAGVVWGATPDRPTSATGPTAPAAGSPGVGDSSTTSAPDGPPAPVLVPTSRDDELDQILGAAPPVLPGPALSCGPPADEKFVCALTGGGSAVVVWRPARDKAGWPGPDKGGSALGTKAGTVPMLGGTGTVTTEGYVLSEVREGVFVTVQGDGDPAIVRRIARHLVWNPVFVPPGAEDK